MNLSQQSIERIREAIKQAYFPVLLAPDSPQQPQNFTSMAPKHGSCLCGAVKYEVAADPVTRVLCHCVHCQKLSGSAFQANLFYKKEDFKLISGQDVLKTYIDTSEAGRHPHRSFCGNCGSNIMAVTLENERIKDFVIVMSGSLDGQNGENMSEGPLQEFYCRNKASWFDVKNDTQQFEALT